MTNTPTKVEQKDTLPDWVAYREAWEELLELAKELKKFSQYLSMEQRRELERVQEDLRALKRNRPI